MDNTKEILTLAVEIGDAMLRCGAEIYRVEDSEISVIINVRFRRHRSG